MTVSAISALWIDHERFLFWMALIFMKQPLGGHRGRAPHSQDWPAPQCAEVEELEELEELEGPRGRGPKRDKTSFHIPAATAVYVMASWRSIWRSYWKFKALSNKSSKLDEKTWLLKNFLLTLKATYTSVFLCDSWLIGKTIDTNACFLICYRYMIKA